jgi:hypothetical protein
MRGGPRNVLTDRPLRWLPVMSEQVETRARAKSRLATAVASASARVSVVAAILCAVALRLPYLRAPVYPDEGGYLLVARYWRSGGPYLYGDLFVDRPPLLLAIFRVADWLGGPDALRLLGVAFVAAMVLESGWAGWLVGGARGARWAAFTAAALLSSPLLGADEVDGELLAAPLVLLSCAALLAVTRRPAGPRTQSGLALLAGMAATAAVLVKQNFLDAGVFAVVLLGTSALTSQRSWPATARTAGAFVAGAALPVVAACIWVVGWGSGLADLWFAVYGFRWRALEVLKAQDLIPRSRAHTLTLSAVQSGVVSLGAIFVASQLRALRRADPLVVAVTAMLVAEVVGVALGANYWNHYLIQVVPSLVLAGACLAGTSGATLLWARLGLAVVLVSAVVTAVNGAIPWPRTSGETAAFSTWIHAAARPRDSLMVAYGHANVFLSSGLRPAYPHLWTLPMRVLDPGLRTLTATMAGQRAPTWVVAWEPLDLLGASEGAAMSGALAGHYSEVADVCGHPVYLLNGVQRQLPATVPSCDD